MQDTTHSESPARLALADGSVFHGTGFGATGRGVVSTAEVVFNTAMCGYQESLTDPSYTGQILVATFPLIGNYGVNEEDVESKKVQVAGFVVRELANRHSNYRSSDDLGAYLAREGVLGLTGIDTRALTRRLRSTGVMAGVLTDKSSAELSDAELVRMAREAPSMAGQNLVPRVGCESGQAWRETLGDWSPGSRETKGRRFRVLAMDCGAKANIFRNLTDRGCDVTVVPHDTAASEISAKFKRGEIDGLFISNGPGGPGGGGADDLVPEGTFDGSERERHPYVWDLPRAPTAVTRGRREHIQAQVWSSGANQPVLNARTGKVEITSQNHGFAVDVDSLARVGGEATHINLNDGTLAGFRMKDRPVFAVQHHPEASPGPHDAGYLFDQFVGLMAAKPAQRT